MESILWLFLLATVFSGCASYHPRYLTPEAIEEKLAVPSTEDICIMAGSLDHPVLKPIVFDDRDGFSPDEAAVLAVLLDPSLTVERDRRLLAGAQLLQAGLLPNPQFSYNINFPTGGPTEGLVNNFATNLNWDIKSLISRSARVDAASAKQAEVDLVVAWKEMQVAQGARMAVYQLVALNKQAQIRNEMEQRLSENVHRVRQAVMNSLLTKLDLAAAEAAYNQAQVALLQITQESGQQLLTLKQLLGLPPDYEIKLQDNIELMDNIDISQLEQFAASLETRRLDLLALRQGYNSQEASVRAAILTQFPIINPGANQSRDFGSFYNAGPGITIGVPIFNRNQGMIAFERSTRKQLFDQYVNSVFAARLTAAKLLKIMLSLNNRITASKEAVQVLEKLLLTYRQALEQGYSDVVIYYNTWSSLAQKRIDLILLKQQLADSRFAFELAVGIYSIEGMLQ
ncbi:MAG: putative outermembrane protein [Candidatus Scalindua brodae]|uniref:Putative outermembrane protein n=1 Tax=Candidatus Scalindua brodae TaxID=237368 RepID=A0A0B0EJC7_9BACT|nr:MAG: putative outermembrane protein [Candidatus Scalindua brodae]